VFFTTNSLLCNVSLVSQFNMSKAGERSRSPKTVVPVASVDDVSDLESRMLAMWNKTIQPLADEQHKVQGEKIKGMVVGIVSTEVKQLEQKMQSGFVEVNEKFSQVNSALERIEKSITLNPFPPVPPPGGLLGPGFSGSSGDALAAPSYAGVASRGMSFAQAVASPGPQPVADVTTPNFSRKANPTKLFCNLHDRAKVSKVQFSNAISVLANEANIKLEDFEILGDALDNRFELQFAGDLRIASVSALQFYESLQLGRGRRKKQVVVDDQDQEVKFYVAPDKNPCQVRREILSKNLQKIVASKKVDKEFFLKKATGSVYENKRVVCSVIITGPETARLDWCHPKRIELGIDQAEVEQEFSNFVLSGGPGS